MNKDTEQEALLRKLTREMDRLDAQYDIPSPSLSTLESLIVAEEQSRRRKTRKERLLFCIVSVILLSSTLALLGYVPVIYLTLQGIIPLAALVGLTVSRIRRWKEGARE
ncbi:YxlC family protein [Paenibacillus sp. NPDC057934]|uniref:YxlC family protein n=1 Tax=Paenibacillus sp. NPDC057934 TaxID=3346282 RepID=UPI0036DF0662